MKYFCKYLGLSVVLLFCFYYTEKMSNIVVNNTILVKEINKASDEYNISPVSAEIDNDYIIPGLNGYSVNVLKSYNNMRFLDTFNSYYLEYDKVLPNISLENNKDKIIKKGNINKKGVSLVVENNLEIINYAKEKNIHLTRLVDHNTYDINFPFEQINHDFVSYKKVELMLNNSNINQNICFVNSNNIDICKKNKKYLVEATYTLNNYNLATIKDHITSGIIIYINDTVSLSDFKILVRQIYYQDLNVLYLSQLISEERA